MLGRRRLKDFHCTSGGGCDFVLGCSNTNGCIEHGAVACGYGVLVSVMNNNIMVDGSHLFWMRLFRLSSALTLLH
jgi:hypothetical protein